MNTLGLIIALLLPAFFGIAWLQLLWREGHLAARIGYGYLLGVFFLTIILRVWDGLGLSLYFMSISGLIIVLSLIPLALGFRLKLNPTKQIQFTSFDAPWEKTIWVLLLSILLIRYGGILLEIIWRPLYPWDAWMNWAPKARTWFELRELTPFVSRTDWAVQSLQNHAYTLGNPPASTYPPLVPLVQTWTALGIGKWIDNFVNLPWIMCVGALGLSFYGQARMIGARPLNAQIWVFLVLTIPYVNTHTALSGYADLWLATFYCLAAMAFMNWALTKDKKQGILMILFALACTQTKVPGIAWAATLVPATVLAILPNRWQNLSIALAVIGAGVWIYGGGFSVKIMDTGTFSLTPELIAIPELGEFSIEYHPIGGSFVLNELIWGNWHLLGWLILVALIPALIRNIGIRPMLAASALILCGLLFIVIVFFFTDHFNAALDNTTINRATVHLFPIIIYYLMLSFTRNSNNQERNRLNFSANNNQAKCEFVTK